MKKLLTLNVTFSGGHARVIITNQSHRTDDFGVSGNSWFKAGNEIYLQSEARPEWSNAGSVLYVRGRATSCDKDVMVIDTPTALKVMAAVAEYNAFDFTDKKSELETAIEAFGSREIMVRNLLKALKLI